MNLSQITDLLSLPGHSDTEFTGFSIDTRQIKPGELYVALKGERFDGHDFIQQAAEKGAAAVLCSQVTEGLTIPQLVVPDSLQSLALIARAHRSMINCPVVALTGSNGKTSVKEMIASILPQPSWATKGNLNNHIGVPLSVLQLNASHRYAVFELGANHRGEIAHTVQIVQPDVALITNIAPAHIEGFGSIQGVADAKGEIYKGLKAGGVAVVNADDDYAHYWDGLLSDKNVLRFSIEAPADIYAEQLCFNDRQWATFRLRLPDEAVDIALQVPGEHNVRNALAAAACCHALGLSSETIAEGLQAFTGVAGRMTWLEGINQSIIIDDTYNANLRSVLTALKVLSARKGKRVFVFGDMGELGPWTQAHHQEVGEAARQYGIEQVMTCGQYSEITQLAFGGSGGHYTSHEALAADLLPQLDANTTVLIKGSRSSAMEKVVQKLI